MKVLHLFTAANVPEKGVAEVPAKAVSWANGITPANLPGQGLDQHPMLYAGENYNKIFIVNDGKVIWTYSSGEICEHDDVWMLSNGNILFTRLDYIAEVTPDKKEIWRYTTEKGGIHTCQPIGLDKVMFVVNGYPPKLFIINIKTGEVEVEQELPYDDPNDDHGQFRRARITAQGTYLISFLNMGCVIEYDKNFNEIWRYEINRPWAAVRLKNGNTMITNEADWITREVNQKGETVWEFNAKTDLPAEYELASAPQTCTVLGNGNLIFNSRGNEKGNSPQLVEITRDKKVVWVLQDWKTLGPATTVQILDDPGIPEVPGELER
ncbi:hypothetical protein ACUNWD_01175 [Sunxiuqinia sp. A32]|uniref:hypothetical protein n=1 Tax=Sunxiuqinia sp. A32 TaxID=3461496 RepID=UPI00404544A1